MGMCPIHYMASATFGLRPYQRSAAVPRICTGGSKKHFAILWTLEGTADLEMLTISAKQMIGHEHPDDFAFVFNEALRQLDGNFSQDCSGSPWPLRAIPSCSVPSNAEPSDCRPVAWARLVRVELQPPSKSQNSH
jgi:hypothetical protein